MKVSLIQMDMKFASPDENFAHAEELIRQAAQSHPDVITLPETWNVGFFQMCIRDIPLGDGRGGPRGGQTHRHGQALWSFFEPAFGGRGARTAGVGSKTGVSWQAVPPAGRPVRPPFRGFGSISGLQFLLSLPGPHDPGPTSSPVSYTHLPLGLKAFSLRGPGRPRRTEGG